MWYFNIKIRLLIREAKSGYVKQEKLSKSKRLIIVFVVVSFLSLKGLKVTLKKCLFDLHKSY